MDFYSRYGLALLITEFEDIKTIDDVTNKHLIELITKELGYYYLKTDGDFKTCQSLKFDFVGHNSTESDKCILSPHIITNHFNKRNQLSSNINILTLLETEVLTKKVDISQGINPIGGKVNNGSNTQTCGKTTLLNAALMLITTITSEKPSYYNGSVKSFVSIIPNLELVDMVLFIQLFKRMKNRNTTDLLSVNVKEKSKFAPKPPLYYGNFPNAPKNDMLNDLGLLGAIGYFGKSEGTNLGDKILDLLKVNPYYIVSYGNLEIYSFDNHVIELAKIGKLHEIITSIFFTKFLNNDHRDLFYFYASRFLRKMDKFSFSNFLTVRASYHYNSENLFINYFLKTIKNMNTETLNSVKSIGNWINKTAYFNGLNESKTKTPSDVAEKKVKYLSSIEAMLNSAKTPSELLLKLTRYVGIDSHQDCPNEGELFLSKLLLGEITISEGKQLLLVYSRLNNKIDKKEEEE